HPAALFPRALRRVRRSRGPGIATPRAVPAHIRGSDLAGAFRVGPRAESGGTTRRRRERVSLREFILIQPSSAKGEAEPGSMEGTADVHDPIADTHVPEAAGSVTKRLLCLPVQSTSECKRRGEKRGHWGPGMAIQGGGQRQA